MQEVELSLERENGDSHPVVPKLRGVRIEDGRIVHATTGTVVAEVRQDAKGPYYAYRDESGRTRFTREIADIEKLGRKKLKVARKNLKRDQGSPE